MAKRTNSQPPIIEVEPEVVYVDAKDTEDHEMRETQNVTVHEQKNIEHLLIPSFGQDPKAVVDSKLVQSLPAQVEVEVDYSTKVTYEGKVPYYRQRIALYRRFGLEQFAKTQTDIHEKFQVITKLKDLETLIEKISLS